MILVMEAMAMAAIAAGADSLMIEVHPNPSLALSNSPQSLTLERFEQLTADMAVVAKVFGRWPKTLTTATLEDIYLQEVTPISSLVEKKLSRFSTHA